MSIATITATAVRRGASAPIGKVVLAITLAQVGGAYAVGLFAQVGPLGTAWLRLVWGAGMLVVIVRPKLRGIAFVDLRAAAILGVVNAFMVLSFFEAVARLPLGVAVALSFVGPLGVAVAKTRGALGLAWPALALIGVLALTTPWQGHVNLVGVGFAMFDGLMWGSYILLTERVANRFEGAQGLVVSMVVAAAVATPFGMAQALHHLTWFPVLASGAVAVLSPVLAFWLEMAALRQLPAATFGTLMCLEPALGLFVGFLLLHQVPTAEQGLGVLLVVAAAYGAERHRSFVEVRHGGGGLA